MRNAARIDFAFYGTLRPGGSLFGHVSPYLRGSRVSRIYGYMFRHRDGGMFPVANLDTTMSTIVTNTLTLPLNSQIAEIIHMEIETGYTPVWVDELERMATMGGFNPTGRKVLAFHFDTIAKRDEVGLSIPGGDWINWRYNQVGQETETEQVTKVEF